MHSIVLIYKQHRFAVLLTLAIGVFLIVGSVVEGYRFSQIHLPAGCSSYTAWNVDAGVWGGPPVAADCLAASRQWLALNGSFERNFIPASPWMVPLLFGVLLGAGLVAGELETGTAPLSWALMGSRRRWLLRRMLAMAILMVPLLIALGFASDYYDGNVQRFNPWASFVDYAGRGQILVFWGLAAFAGTVAVSSLMGRTVPAVFLAAIICLVVRGPWEMGANQTFLAPMSRALVTQQQAQTGEWAEEIAYTALVTERRQYMNGEPFVGDVWAYYNAHPRAVTGPDGYAGFVYGPPNPGEATDVPYPYEVPFGFHGDSYWPIVVLESGILLAGSLVFAGVALFSVNRRRPY